MIKDTIENNTEVEHMEREEKAVIRLIASDLDGTLFDGKKEIRPFTEQILTDAIKQGIYFVPSTGRPIGSVTENVLQIPGIRYLICSNGAAIYSFPERERIYEKILLAASVRGIRGIARKETIAMEAFIKGEPYAEKRYVEDPAAFGATAFGVGYVKRTRTPIENWNEFLALHESEFDSVSFASSDYEALTELRRALLEKVPDIYAIWSFTHLLEVGHIDAGKGETLRKLLGMLDISPEEAMAFGDAENDITMLKAVKYGIAMGNATDDVKEAAFDVTDTNEKDGVGKGIIKYCCFL